MANTPNSSSQQILHLKQGAHATALDQAEKLKNEDPKSGRLTLCVCTQMNDFLAMNCLKSAAKSPRRLAALRFGR